MSTLKTDVLKDVAETVTINVVDIAADIASADPLLRQDLANSALATKGAGLVGFDPLVAYAAGTVGDALNSISTGIVTPSQFGAVGDGVTNDSAAFTSLEAAEPGATVNLEGKSYAVTAVPSAAVYINGNFVVASVSREAWGASKVNKVMLHGLEPERVSETILRIFPGACSDGANDPSEIIELLTPYDIDRTVSGLGGVDNGSYVAGEDYFVYMLKNPTTGDVGAVISQEISVTLVTKPAGYTLIRKLPWGYISIAGGIPAIHLSYWPLPYTSYTDFEEAAQWRVLALGTSTTFTSFSLTSLVPDNARLVRLMIKVERIANGGKAFLRTTGAQTIGIPVGGVADVVGAQSYNFLDVRVTSLRELSYKVDSGVRLSVFVMGYSQTERS